MKVYSDTQLPNYQVLGTRLLIHWDAQQIAAPVMRDGEKQRLQWVAAEADCIVSDSKEQLEIKILESFCENQNITEPCSEYDEFLSRAEELAMGWQAEQS